MPRSECANEGDLGCRRFFAQVFQTVQPEPFRRMQSIIAKRLTPILNVSNIQESFAWFEKLGWQKGWDWGSPPTFGGVCSGHCEIFLCQDGQGGRGKSDVKMTFGPNGDEAG